MSAGKGGTEAAGEAQAAEVAEKANTQISRQADKTSIQVANTFMPEPSIYETPSCSADIQDVSGDIIVKLPEKADIPLKLSGMLMMQSPVLQSLSMTQALEPEEETKAVSDETEDEPAEEAETEQEYSDKEKKMIAYVVFAEARGESFDGKVAVAQVVINRYESGKFGKSIKRVVYAKNQFAVSKRYSETCMEAVEYAIENSPYPEDMYYFQVSNRKKWRNFEYYRRIGNHSFYCGK